MKSIVFLESNKSGSSREAIRAAENMGYLTVLITNRKRTLHQREEFPDVHQMYYCNLSNVEEIEKIIDYLKELGLEIQLIVSFVDPYVCTASLLMDKCCEKNQLNTSAISKMEDKYETRKTLASKPYTPFFELYNGELTITDFTDEAKKHLPLIVKSPNSTGSKDVFLAVTREELEYHISILREKYPGKSVLVEEYVDGPQYLVEAMIIDGTPHLIAVIEQEITKKQRFIVTGYCVLAEVEKSLNTSLKRLVTSISRSFQFTNGAMHLEIRRKGDKWKLIEINPRISGGAMNKMVETAFNINLVKETLRLYLGERPEITPKTNKFVFTQYVIVSKPGKLLKVTGRNKAENSPGVVSVYIKPRKGTVLIPPLSMGNRYAYVIARGETKDEATNLAKEAADLIEFHLDDETSTD
ncbi:ATP-grasp domain-containing protein [Anaerobacillus alkaliphilus]|uniref:ATP-grasp domain-containing protein n=1 Tax=Anaerobacillus alkaliphilus TaxID=1548597 RepID=A0A4Q0VNP7_9BACI|nr:ATP-grasp domain-containing protein [Anaerobacillus alkaliphilus]RXI96462.1 ATP-grasp domain-containing protein [Anaerobacillus alkaliphilus]